MTTFTIDTDNNITAHATPDEATAVSGAERFTTAAELAELAANWPANRLVDVWNSLPGVSPVDKFKTSKTAVGRIWARIQGLGEAGQEDDEEGHPGGTEAPRCNVQGEVGPEDRPRQAGP